MRADPLDERDLGRIARVGDRMRHVGDAGCDANDRLVLRGQHVGERAGRERDPSLRGGLALGGLDPDLLAGRLATDQLSRRLDLRCDRPRRPFEEQREPVGPVESTALGVRPERSTASARSGSAGATTVAVASGTG